MVAIVAAVTLSAQPLSEIDLLVGQTMKFHPAGTHLNGFSVEDGEEFIEASQNGTQLVLKGLKAGDATLKLALRAGKESKLLVHVKSVSFVKTASKPDDPQKPEWTGTYELRLPASNYSIIYHSFNSDGSERIRESYSCIDALFVDGECFESEDGGYAGMEDIIDMYDFDEELGYSGGLMPNGHYKMYYGDGNEISPDNIRDATDWFEMYAPESLAFALQKSQDLTDFGRDNNGDDDLEPGVVMQRLRQMGQDQSYLKRYYLGMETVCGVRCWVFDFRSTGVFGGYRTCWWIDPATGLVLRAAHEDGSGFIVTRYDLDYNAWDIEIRPDLFE